MTGTDGPAPARGLSRSGGDFLLQPECLSSGDAGADLIAAGLARPLAGGPLAFSAVRLHPVAGAAGPVTTVPLGELPAAGGPLLDRLAAPRPPFAGIGLDRPRVMGIVNVTPDSFSDGGAFIAPDDAVRHGLGLLAAGADILDVGGESTRPGAEPVPAEEELRRVLPVVRALAAAGATVSIDTRQATVMRAAIEAGARIVNDITALTGDPDSLAAVAESDAAVVLMHMQGEPRTMQLAPAYVHAPSEVFQYLARRIDACMTAGISSERIAVDPGLGFGKTVEHNLALIEALPVLHGLGCAVLLGVSRKGFLGRLGGGERAGDRLAASVAAALRGFDRGADIVRVHDVVDSVRALALWRALHPPFGSEH